jgi:tetratricopeptide (TPR) repeat protein
MKSLYDVLGARADDDAPAIKKAFRTAVKAYHPDLHPNDPEAELRFRRIITAAAVLRDKRQRAAYDQLLNIERQQIRPRLDHRRLQLQYARRHTRLKLGATALIVVVCAAVSGYGLLMLMPVPTTAIVAVMNDRPVTVKAATIVEAINKDKVAVSAAGPVATDTVTETPSAAAITEAAKDDKDGAGPKEEAHAGTASAETDDAPMPSVVRSAADKGDAVALVDREPAPVRRNDASFYRDLGTASYRVGDFPRAIVSLDEAIRLDPGDAKAYNIRGNAWDEIGVFESALADYDSAIRIDPNNPVFFRDRAVMWHRRGDLDKALVDLDRAVRFTFSDANIYCDRGLIWYEKGSRARAVADFDHAIKIDPDFAAAYISRGLILHGDTEFNVAFAELGRTIRVGPDVFDATKKVEMTGSPTRRRRLRPD